MPVPSYTAELVSCRNIARDIYELIFKKPEGMTFKAGQYVIFDVPAPDNPTDLQARAYSIASAPHESNLLFIIKLTPNGRMSRWILGGPKPGATLPMKAPFGIFTLDPASSKNLLLIGTSTGIAPYRAHIMELIESKDKRRIDLVYGARSKADLFWLDVLADLKERHGNMGVHFGLTSGEADWDGHHGRVQTIVPEIIKDFSSVRAYVCGNPDMVKETKDLCLGTWSIPKPDVKWESYI